MTVYTIKPLDVKDVNVFIEEPYFSVINNAVNNLYFSLRIVDGFGERRFCPHVGSVITVSFIKSRSATAGSAATLITKTATSPYTCDSSIMKITLSAEESSLLITGGLTLSVNGAVFAVNNIVKKIYGDPGY